MSTIVMIAGLGFGDEGKGTTTEFFVRKLNAKTVVRYNGGAQAGHTVELADGTRHVFSQFGCGTFAGANTFLSKYMLISPFNMMCEAIELKRLGVLNPMSMMYVSNDCLVVTPFHVYANRIREEERGDHRHGSCGMGIGEAVDLNIKHPEWSIQAKHLEGKLISIQERLEQIRLHYLQEFKGNTSAHYEMIQDQDLTRSISQQYRTWSELVNLIDDTNALETILEGNVVFEGAQGVLLDEDKGFRPHNTWTSCLFSNVRALLSPFIDREHTESRVGVLRSYSTRHGAGPFVTEHSDLSVLSEDKTNQTNSWQSSFRRGYFDLVLARYAVQAIGEMEEIVLTHMDQAEDLPDFQVCVDYTIKGKITDSLLKFTKPIYQKLNPINLPDFLIDELNTPIRITSLGPTFEDKFIA